MFGTRKIVTKFTESEFPNQVLPVPAAAPPVRRFFGDTGDMEQASMGFIHGLGLQSS